jgi:hypothetical protein
MISLSDVAQNWGDFSSQIGMLPSANPRPAYEGFNPGRVSSAELGAWSGSSPTSVNEAGFQNMTHRLREVYSDTMRRRRYESRLQEAARIITRGFNGSKRDLLNLQEAMSIGDFPNLFGDVIDRAVLANYTETPYTWNLIAHEAEVNDFRPVKRFRVDGGTGLLGPTDATLTAFGGLVPLERGANYPEDSLTVPTPYTYELFKRGKRMPFYWETFVNDDLQAIKDTPARFGRGARREEEYFCTALFANNANFFNSGNKNIVTAALVGDGGSDHPALSIHSLQRAMIVMMKQVDTTGQPISIEAMTLVVPPSLKTVAANILNTDYVFMADQGGTVQIPGGSTNPMLAQMLHAMNWAKNIVRLAVNYYLPIIDTTYGNTGWYLFANPESGRPAIEMGFLRGHKTPELFMKLPNAVAIGEGQMGPGPGVMPGTANANPMEGDFDTDSIHYKIRTVKGGTLLDPLMAVMSQGSGAGTFSAQASSDTPSGTPGDSMRHPVVEPAHHEVNEGKHKR